MMELAELSELVRHAVAEARRPPPPGGSKPLTFPSDHLGDRGWGLVWEAVQAIRDLDARTFVRFSELTLALLVVDVLEEQPTLDLPELGAALAKRAEGYGPRVVSTPICHVSMERSAVRLADDAVLVRAHDDRHAPNTDEDIAADFLVEQTFGTRMSRPLRNVDAARPTDTTRTAAVLTLEEGVPPLALARARARAQYAIALWTVLKPPDGRRLLPDVGIWAPQPDVHLPQRHRRIVEGAASQATVVEEGGGLNEYGPFVLPAEEELRLPFRAMAHVDRRGAQAVLSAGLHLLNAGRASRLLPSERARALMAAVEALGEQPSGKGARNRFLRLARRYGTDAAVAARGWSPERIEAAFGRMVKVRNISTHGADAVLLDLGYPLEARRKMLYGQEALGTELAAGSLQSDLPVLVHVVGRTLDRAIRELAEDQWQDSAFESYFR